MQGTWIEAARMQTTFARRVLPRIALATLATIGAIALPRPADLRADQKAVEPGPEAVLVIHGGCGVLTRREMTRLGKQAEYKAGLERSLRAGFDVWQRGGGSVDVVEAAIRQLEDCELFNAGKGAVFTREGRNELDASIMDGKTGEAGAVASVTNIKNPITAARKVMEHSGHVLMVGAGAERFAESMQCEIVPPHYFWTQFRWDQYQAALREERQKPAAAPSSSTKSTKSSKTTPRRDDPHRFGTVGAVALDKAGNLAAGTSTGGLNFKRHGRVGDSPVIGGGNYANNKTCAVSSTGDGEFFLRAVAAYDISARVAYQPSTSLAQACNEVMAKIREAGGDGAVIALSPTGRAALSYNTEGMYRGYVDKNGQIHVFIYDEELK